MQANRIHNQPSDEVLAKEIAYYHELATIYNSLIGHKQYPFATVLAIASLRCAAALDDTDALYQLGEKFINEAKLREQLQNEELFATSANERQMKQLYEEALAYLQKAEELGHIKAKRLHGLCYINGWGVSVDKDKGFELVVESIEQENSWDQVPQIFAEIGLNKPEFFSALMKKRTKG
ncbi:MAG: sel1 repeat family protein [Tatlockia sp.]|nr:sel1 repeat family protein [Tatlockia sp.]